MEKENKKDIDSVKRDILSINTKVEVLSRENEENMHSSMQESETSHEEDHVSGSSISHRSHKHGHNERVERHGRRKRERNQPRRDDLESVKFKFLLFLRENKLDANLDWEMKEDEKALYDTWAELCHPTMLETYMLSYKDYTKGLRV
ncbi:hypothetical protein CR513_46300, partial [Mucuna pruriens]